MKNLTILTLVSLCSFFSFAQDDSLDCESIIMDFTHEIIGDEITLTNTSIGVPDDAYVGWTVNPGFDDGAGEEITFSTLDYEGLVQFCLIIHADIGDLECRDSSCITLEFLDDSLDVFDCDSIEIDFTYEMMWDEITLTNTSSGVPDGALVRWTVNPSFDEGLGETITFSTEDYVGEMDFCLTIDYVEMGETICRDSVCTTIDFPEDTTDCELDVSYTYEITPDEIIFTNTSTGEPLDASYSWTFGELSSTDENPIFPREDLGPEEVACLVIYDEFWDCYDSTCTTIEFPIEFGCDSMIVSFDFIVYEDMIMLENTSTGEPADVTYNWSINHVSSSVSENPTFYTADFDDEEEICLTIFSEELGCIDSICAIIGFSDDLFDCDVDASFTYEIIDDEITFTNTSIGGDPLITHWWIDGLSSSEENPTFPTTDFELTEDVYFHIYTDTIYICYDSIQTTISFPEDFIDCDSMIIDFTYEIIGDEITLTSISDRIPEDATYRWTVNPGFEEALGEETTFSTEGFEGELNFCLTIESDEFDCIDSLCVPILFEVDSLDPFDCDSMEIDFTYVIIGDEITLTNTSEGTPDDATYRWTVNPGFEEALGEVTTFSTEDFEGELNFCLTVESDEFDCIDSLCVPILFEADSLDPFDCDSIEIDFTYIITADEILFTNTSTGVPDGAFYNWSINHVSSSTEENPIFSIEDFIEEEFCLTIYIEDFECYDSICTTIIFVEEECDLVVDFTYEITGDDIIFTNNSTGMPLDPYFYWSVDHEIVSFDENHTMSMLDLDDSSLICFAVYNDSWSPTCVDSVCFTFGSLDDSVICDLDASFTHVTAEGIITFTNTSIGESADATYFWEIDGLTSTDENPTFSTDDFEITEEVTFYVYNDSADLCFDSMTATILFVEELAAVEGREMVPVEVDIYPNPADNILNVTIKNAHEDHYVYIYNSLGELIRTGEIDQNTPSLQMDLANLPSGFYIIHLLNSTHPELNYQQKFTKR